MSTIFAFRKREIKKLIKRGKEEQNIDVSKSFKILGSGTSLHYRFCFNKTSSETPVIIFFFSDALNFHSQPPLCAKTKPPHCVFALQSNIFKNILSACNAQARDTELFPRMHSHILSAASEIQERNPTPACISQHPSVRTQGSLSLLAFC
jgi:hypothetical protein